MSNTKQFHRYFKTPGQPLYWIIIAYIILAWFFPVVGLLALICMIGPVVTSIYKGRWWCGNVCPRGNMYETQLDAEHGEDEKHHEQAETEGAHKLGYCAMG